MIRLFLLTALIVMVGAVTLDVQAQQDQSDPERTLLPEIDPQDIEIRSQFQARFPGLNRQPILGFNPRPRVFQTDPDRIPFIEDEEAILASLPIGELDRPEAPEYQRLGYTDPRNIFFRGGIGSEFSPEADLFAVARINDRNWVSGNVNYTSSDGHAESENLTTSYRYADASINVYSRFSDRTDLRFSAGAISNFNHMLQLGTESQNLLDTNTRVSQTGFRGSAKIDVARTSLTGVVVDGSGYYNEFLFDSDLGSFDGAASEWGLNAGGEYTRLGRNIDEYHRVRLRSNSGGIQPFGGVMQSWGVSTLSAHYERLFNYQTDLKVSAGISGVSDAEDDFTLYFSPEIELKHTFFTGLNFRAKAAGTPSHYSLAKVQRENRFFDMASTLRHQYEMIALAEIQMEPFYGTKIIGGISFQDIKNYLYYERRESPMGIFEINQGYYTANFRDANIFRVYGGFTQDLRPDIIWFSADGHWQTPNFSDTNQKIPYVENLSVKATVSLRPVDQLLVEGWGQFNSGRVDHQGEDMSSFMVMGGKFELSLTDQFGFYAKILNFLNEDYQLWQGYRERGLQGFVGLTYLF
jgi:hypothetical protein